ncbi:MAG: tRNA pseudouridine(55) synthase TruB [Christensenellales bacterium]
MNGILNLLKPPGLSSARAVSHIKKLTGEKVGHAGTLDPEACGVLPIMIGRATRLFDYLAEGEKTYVAEIAFGASTDTQDATGRIIIIGSAYPNAETLSALLPRFCGDILQRPPAYSAIKKDGEALYKSARRGEPLEAEERLIKVHGIDLLEETAHHGFLLRIRCGKGTYIRTLCHDIGIALGCPAHMRLLIRERTGRFLIGQAITLEEFSQGMESGVQTGPWLSTVEDCLSHLPRLTARDALWKAGINGVPLDASAVEGSEGLQEGGCGVLYCRGALLGICALQAGQLRVRTMLHEAGEAFREGPIS